MEKQTVTIVRGATDAGTTDPDTGVFTPGGAAGDVLWEGRATYLDQGPQDRFNAEGVAEYSADGSVYLPRNVIEQVHPKEGDSVRVTYQNGDTVDAEIAKVIRYKRRLDVRRA